MPGRLERGPEVIDGVAGDRRQRAGAQRPGIVDQQVGAAELLGGLAQGHEVRRVCDVAGHRGHRCAVGQAGRRGQQRRAVSRVEHQRVPVFREPAGEGEAEAT
jgi:hypothetical protein